MEKFVLKIFDLIKEVIYFFKIVILFFALILILYWIKDLSGFHWLWIKIFSPVIIILLDLGQKINNNSISIFNTIFEYKYLFAMLILLIFYFSTNIIISFIVKLEELYKISNKKLKEMNEKIFNKKLELIQNTEQKAIKNYVVYVEARIKKEYDNKNFNIDIKEQNKMMNKFLIEKTFILPEVFSEGFLYRFSDFENIDNILKIFFKLLNTKTPIDYVIAVQVCAKNFEIEKKELKKLVDLAVINKIIMFAKTAYRYNFNKIKKYESSLIGIFQNGEKTIEIYSFNSN